MAGQWSSKTHGYSCADCKKVKSLSYCLERTTPHSPGAPHQHPMHPSPSLIPPSHHYNPSTSVSRVLLQHYDKTFVRIRHPALSGISVVKHFEYTAGVVG